MIKTKSIFLSKEDSDGTRILITQGEPGKLRKFHFDEHVKELGPSSELLSDYKGWSGKTISWEEYERRFLEEMNSQESKKKIEELAGRSLNGETITLLCYEGEKNPHCHRHIIKKLILEEKVKSMNYFYEKPYSMICGQTEAQKRRYKKLVGKSGRIWLAAIQDNPADNIYVSADPKENTPGYGGFRGFGGATLEFELEDGTIEKLTGPWHANCENLFEDTEYDIRDKHKTFGVVAKRREGNWLKDVLHKDENWVIGEFDRIEKIAQKFANELNQVVYFYQETQGGSSCCPVEPEM